MCSMALMARVLESFSDRVLSIAKDGDLEPGDFVGCCTCPECGKLLEVRDVNGGPIRKK